MAKLQILSGKRQGAVIELATGDVDIGNRKSAKLSIRDPWISYNHAKISGQDGRFYIEDLGSSNGTWINGEKIKRHELTTSVLIYFGKTKVRFTTDGGGGSSASHPKGEDTSPWWDKVLDDKQGKGGGADPAKVRQLQSELTDQAACWQEPRSEQDIPDDEVIAVVVVRLCCDSRVVPAVKLRSADHVVQRAELHVHIAVLEETVDGVEHEVERQHRFGHAQHDERQGVQQVLQGFFQGMKARHVQPVQPRWRVVHRVQPPQRRIAVAGNVQPVTQEVGGQQHEKRLERHGP